MTNTLNNIKLSLRSDDLSNWISADPILKNGEFAIVLKENGTKDIKIGNGLSSFSQLKYIYQESFGTDTLNTKDLKAKSLTQGYNVKTTPTSMATGVLTQAEGDFDVVHGVKSAALSDDTYSFVFNGDEDVSSGLYTSHGVGSFSINPKQGISGFYIGEDTLDYIIRNNVDITSISCGGANIQ